MQRREPGCRLLDENAAKREPIDGATGQRFRYAHVPGERISIALVILPKLPPKDHSALAQINSIWLPAIGTILRGFFCQAVLARMQTESKGR